jgi:hypothetical protein
MAILLRVVGVIVVLVGGIWILQGFNILPGSFMSGQMKWAVNGGIAATAGVALIVGSFFFAKRSS